VNGPGLFAAHVPGSTFLHRAPLWLKLIGVLVIGTLPWFVTTVSVMLVVSAALVVLVAVAGLPGHRLLRSLRALLPALAVIAAYQWWTHDPSYAARVVLGITNAFVAAGILTATTPVTDLLDGVVRATIPLRRFVDPEVVALTVAVVLRSVPWVVGSFAAVRQSARARGLDRNPRAVVVPTVVHTVAYARATGEALAARGLTDAELPEA